MRPGAPHWFWRIVLGIALTSVGSVFFFLWIGRPWEGWIVTFLLVLGWLPVMGRAERLDRRAGIDTSSWSERWHFRWGMVALAVLLGLALFLIVATAIIATT